MKQYSHAWIALMASKRLYEKKDTLSDDNKKIVNRLLKFLRQNNDGIVQGAWFPDSIIHDNSTGHIWKYRKPKAGESARQQEHKLPSASQVPELVSDRADNERVVLEKGVLPDRCQALAYQMRDQLKVKHEIAYGKNRDAGAAIIATNNEIALGLYMLAHYVGDAHMPLHCDARNFGKGVHDEIEKNWEDAIIENYSLLTDPTQKEKRFKLDRNGIPKLKKDVDISGTFLGDVIDEIKSRRFQIGFGADNGNFWDYMVDICYYSYLLSTSIIPQTISDPRGITKSRFRQDFEQKFLDATPAILADAVDALARIWFNMWRDYEKM